MPIDPPGVVRGLPGGHRRSPALRFAAWRMAFQEFLEVAPPTPADATVAQVVDESPS